MRESVRRAIEEELDGVPSKLPRYNPPTLEDECPVCGSELRVYDKSWERMQTDQGILACANYCGPACYEEQERIQLEVLLVLRRRQQKIREQ